MLLLQATRSIVITINNFAGEGLGPLTCAHLRLTDVSSADASQHKSMGWCRFPSTPGAHKDRPTVVMAKLYKARPLIPIGAAAGVAHQLLLGQQHLTVDLVFFCLKHHVSP